MPFHKAPSLESLERGDPLPHITTDPEQPMTHIDTIAENIPTGDAWRDHFPHLTVEAPTPAQG